MKTVDLSALNASSPSVLFSTLVPVVESACEPHLLVVFIKGSDVVALETSAFPVSWLDVIEDLPTSASSHDADSFVMVVWGEKAGEELPEAQGVMEVISCLQHSKQPQLKDVFFCDGQRYWSYMCEGCCDPAGKTVVVTDAQPADNGADADLAWRMLVDLTELSDDHEDVEWLLLRLCEAVQDVRVRDSLLCHIALSEASPAARLVACISWATNHATEAQMPRVAGMVAALKAAYEHPEGEIQEVLEKAGSDSLAALVRHGIERQVPPSLYRSIFVDAAAKLAIAS